MTVALTPLHSESSLQTRFLVVLEIRALPRILRPQVEAAMVECLSESTIVSPVTDYLTANWFTPWTTTPGRAHHVDCTQLLSGTQAEITALAGRLAHIVEGGCACGLRGALGCD